MKRFLGLLVGFLMLGTGFVFAEVSCEKGMEHGKEMKHEKEMMCKKGGRGEDVGNVKWYLKNSAELNLTNEQVKSLEKIRMDCKRDAIKRQADIKLARLDLRELIKQEKPDFVSVRAKIKQISELQLTSKFAMIDAMESGFNALTKEQQDKLPQLKKKRKENCKKNKTCEKK
ncbi:MAG: Spy/CpxP family protein refolding chaperone [Elusimicrobiota bacterium]